MSEEALSLRPGGRWAWTRWFSAFWGALWNPEKGAQSAGPDRISTRSGTPVDDTRALSISAAFRCIRIIAETAGSLPLRCYRRVSADEGEPLEDSHWLPRLMQQPNETMTGDEWREAMHAQMSGWGNGYSQIVLNNDPRGRVPIELWPYKPASMEVDRRADRTLRYRYPDVNGALQWQEDGRVLHMRAFSIDGVMGLSPLAYARETLGLTAAAEDYAASFFFQGGRPSGVMNVDKILQQSQRDEIRKQFASMAEGGDGKRWWLLEAGMKYQPITVSPEDMQMLQTRAFQVADIARFFGVPLFLLMETEKSTSWGSGIEQQNLAFLTYTLRPYLTRLEATINRFLIPEKERGKIYVEHDVAPLLMADSKTRSEYLSKMVQNGIMDRDEARRREKLRPRGGAAGELTAQVNLAPLDMLGKLPTPRTVEKPDEEPEKEPATETEQ